MSLQVWLTGNNSMNNQGLLGELTQTNATSYVDGKLGKAMSTGGYKMSAEQTAQVLNNEQISICFWVYINADDGATDNRAMFFGNSDIGSNNNRKFSLFNYPTVNDFHWSWMNDTANNTFVVGVLSGVLPSYKWTHVAITYQNPHGTVYINGEKVTTFTGVSNSSTFAYETQVIHNSSYLKWNDYRIYNHCISAKEVKEISKGLVCHYPLKSQYETGQVNKYSGDVAEGSLSMYGAFTKTKLEGERGYSYKFSCTGDGNNRWDNMNAGSTFSFTAGKKYYYSCKVRCHSTNFVLALRASRSGNDWVTNSTNVLNPDGEWHEYVVYQTINSTYDRSGSTVTCNPILEFYTDNLSTSGKVYSADFDIKDIQVIESDCYVPFIDNDMVSNVVGDCSGYGNNGTKIGDIAWSGDSARYSGSYYFASKSHYKIPCPLASPQEFSCSFWIKPISWGGYAIISSNYNNPSSGFWLAVNCEGCGLWFYNGSYARSNKGLLSPNTWYHVCFVFNKGIITWYQNGEVAGVTDLSSRTTTLWIKDYISIGNSYTGTIWNTNYSGNISDFRIYSTILSAEDVKSIYNVSASIDKTGDLFCGEVMEN